MDEIRRRQIKLGLKLIGLLIAFIVLSVAVCTNWFQFDKNKKTDDENINPIFTEDEIDEYIKVELENNPDADPEQIRQDLMSFINTEIEDDEDYSNQESKYSSDKIKEFLNGIGIGSDEENEPIEQEPIEESKENEEEPEETNNSGYDPNKIKEFLNEQNPENNEMAKSGE